MATHPIFALNYNYRRYNSFIYSIDKQLEMVANYWLENNLIGHFITMNDDSEEECKISYHLFFYFNLVVTQSIRVIGEHPASTFKVGDFVIVLSTDKDPFWVAQVTNSDEEHIYFRYYHYKLNSKQQKIWCEHDSHGSCGFLDVLTRFKNESELFTKSKIIRKQAQNKINQALALYTGKC